MTRRFTRRALLAVLACTGLSGLVPVEARQDARVVAVADVHGSIDSLTSILRRAGLIDESNRWTGGRATFVQTGDVLDRGAGVRRVLDLLMDLEGQARKSGGRVVVLLGNHEIMNLLGDTRDVGVDAYATFADGESGARRERAYEAYEKLAASKAASGREVPPVYSQPREVWMAAHPPGWLEYRDAFGPKGAYGAWLRRKPIFAKASGTLFMHAGPDPAVTPAIRVEDADRQVRSEIQRFDRFRDRLVAAKLALPFFSMDEVIQVAAAEIQAANAVVAAAKAEGRQPDFTGFDINLLRESTEIMGIADWASIAPEGPLWYRGYADAPDAALDAVLTPFLEQNGVTRIAVGHTPQRDGRITARLGGRILLMDTGMLTEVYKGRPSALDLAPGRAAAVYMDREDALPVPPFGPAQRVLREVERTAGR
jgi:hypothetical protein